MGTVDQNQELYLFDDYPSEAMTNEYDRSIFLQVGKLMHLDEPLQWCAYRWA